MVAKEYIAMNPYPRIRLTPLATAARGPSPLAVNVYSDPAVARRRVNWLIVTAANTVSSTAITAAHSPPSPLCRASMAGTVAAAADGAIAETDCASTPENPRLRRCRPDIGEVAPTPATGSG